MLKIFTNKKIWKMLILVILVIMAVQILTPTTIVYAKEDDSDAAQEGDNIVSRGILMRPILSFVVSIGDGAMSILHSQIMGQENSLLPITLGDTPGWIGITLGIIAGLIVAVATVALIATGLAAIGAVIAAIGAEVAVASIGAGTIVFGAALGGMAGFAVYDNVMPETLYLPAYTYSAEEIFKGNILLFNVNFFDIESKEIWVCYTKTDEKDDNKKPLKTRLNTYNNKIKNGEGPFTVEYYYYYYNGIEDEKHEIKTSPQDSAAFLRKTIATWYITLRNICIVGMLSVLIYIGIRMMLSTVANDKAKYKEMLKDWLVGICLLFVMHYIMSFSVTMVEKITDIVKTSADKNFYMGIIEDKDGKIGKAVEGTELAEHIKDGYLYYPTNLMGYLRIAMQKIDNNGEYIGMVICFIMLVTFTIMFSFTYLRRLLYMAFLTLIAPLVALTYPIDKISDGQAQGFNTWIKEYLFNLLIQPMHLLLYFILVTSAFNLAGKNVIYSIIALAFMLPAEKLLRRMFGFEKAKTPPLLGGPVGASLMMQGINSLSRIARGGKAPSRGGNNGSQSNDENHSINFAESANEMETIAGNIPDRETTNAHETEEEESPIRIAGQEEPLNIGEPSETESPIVIAGQTPPLNIGEAGEEESPIRMAGQTPPLNIGGADEAESLTHPNNQIPTTDTIRMNPDNQDEEGLTKSQLKRMQMARLARSVLSAVKTEGRTTLKNAPKNIGTAAYKGITGTAKKIPGAAIGAATGAAVATLGGSMALASGDAKNVATVTGTAAGIGYSVGSRISNGMTTTNLNESTRAAIEAANDTYNNEEWKDLEREQKIQELTNDPINQEKARNALNGKEPIQQGETRKEADDRANKEFMDNYKQMINYGITDVDRALALHQGVKDGDFNNLDDAIAHSKLYDRFGKKDPEKMGAKERDDFNKTMVRGLKSAGGERVTDEMAMQETNNTAIKLSRLHKRLN